MKKNKKKIYYQLSDEMKKSHYFIIKMNEQAALSILETMGSDNFCIEQLKVKQAIESILDSYQQEKEKNKNLIKQLQDLSKQLREKEQENIKIWSNINKYFARKQNVTNNYLLGLSACSSDLNLIKQKDYSQLIRLFKCAEEQNKDFVKDVEAFDELVTKLTTGEYSIIKMEG